MSEREKIIYVNDSPVLTVAFSQTNNNGSFWLYSDVAAELDVTLRIMLADRSYRPRTHLGWSQKKIFSHFLVVPPPRGEEATDEVRSCK